MYFVVLIVVAAVVDQCNNFVAHNYVVVMVVGDADYSSLARNQGSDNSFAVGYLRIGYMVVGAVDTDLPVD